LADLIEVDRSFPLFLPLTGCHGIPG
jgi:hypothetical protein